MPLLRRIVLWACFFTFVFMGTTWLFNGCKSETSKALDVADDISEVAEESVKDVEENVKELSDKFFEDDDEIIYTNEDEEEDSELANDLFREEPTEVVTKKPAKKKVSTPTPVRSSANGRYLVVAGNYLVESNAKEMVKKLRNMGFSDAEHMVFDQSQYYTVLASRSDSRNTAQSSSDKLKGKGIDNYVHTQRD